MIPMRKSKRLLLNISKQESSASTYSPNVDEIGFQETDARSTQKSKMRRTIKVLSSSSFCGSSCYYPEEAVEENTVENVKNLSSKSRVRDTSQTGTSFDKESYAGIMPESTTKQQSVSLPECADSSPHSGIYEKSVKELDVITIIEEMKASCITPPQYNYSSDSYDSDVTTEILPDAEGANIGSHSQVHSVAQYETLFDSIKVDVNAIPDTQKCDAIYSYVSPITLSACGSKCYVPGRAAKQPLEGDAKLEFTSKKKNINSSRSANSVVTPYIVDESELSNNDEDEMTMAQNEKYWKMRALNRAAGKRYRERKKNTKEENKKINQNLLAKIEELTELCDAQRKKIRFLEELVNKHYGPNAYKKP